MMKYKPTVFVTGTHSDAVNDNTGLDLWWIPVIKTEPLLFDEHLLAEAFDWIIFTSRNAVEYMEPYLDRVAYKQVASIGTKTSDTLRSHGVEPDFECDVFSQEGFIDKFPVEKHLRVLYPASKNRRPKLESYLIEQHCHVSTIDLYQPTTSDESIDYLLTHLYRADALTFASPSAVHAVMNHHNMNDEQHQLLSKKLIVSIGPVTALVVEQYGLTTTYPETYTNKETIKLLCKLLEVS